MIPIERKYILNTAPKIDILKDYTFTNESGAHQFTITAMEDGADASFSGTATAYFIRSNGTTCTVTAEIIGGKIYATLNADCYNVPGRFRFSIFNVNNGITCCVYSAKGEVYRTITTPVIDSGEVVPSLDEIEALFDDMKTAKQNCINAANLATGLGIALAPYNAFDAFGSASKVNGTMNGVTFSWDKNTCTLTGAIQSGSNSAYQYLFNSQYSLPVGINPGDTLHLLTAISPAWIGIQYYNGTSWIKQNGTTGWDYRANAGSTITVPDTAIGIRIQFGVSMAFESGTVFTLALMTSTLTNQELNALINDLPQQRGIAPDPTGGFDLDNALSSGTYILAGGRTYIHAPWGNSQPSGLSTLEVFWGAPNIPIQRLYNRNLGEFYRYRYSDEWFDWAQMSIPPAPTANGTYNLRCVVTSGVPAFSWVSV